MTTDPKTVVLNWTDALNHGDLEAAASYLHDDFVFVDTGFGMRIEGLAAWRETAAAGIFTELNIVKTTFLVDGDTFANEWVMSGVHSGDAPGLPATGRSFRISGAGFGEVRDGRMVRVTEYWNMADFLTQVGVLPPPGPPEAGP